MLVLHQHKPDVEQRCPLNEFIAASSQIGCRSEILLRSLVVTRQCASPARQREFGLQVSSCTWNQLFGFAEDGLRLRRPVEAAESFALNDFYACRNFGGYLRRRFRSEQLNRLLRIAQTQIRLCLQNPKSPTPDGVASFRLSVSLIRLLKCGLKKPPRELLPSMRVKLLWLEITLASYKKAKDQPELPPLPPAPPPDVPPVPTEHMYT